MEKKNSTLITLFMLLGIDKFAKISTESEIREKYQCVEGSYLVALFFSLPSKYIEMYIRSENHKMVIVLCKILVLRPRSSK